MFHESIYEAVFIPTTGSEEELAEATYLAALADPTPDGKLLADLAARKIGMVAVPGNSELIYSEQDPSICGLDSSEHLIRKGSIDAVEDWVKLVGGYFHGKVRRVVTQIVGRGGKAIVIANEKSALGVIALRTSP